MKKLLLTSALLVLSSCQVWPQSGYFPSCYRDLLSDACESELQRHRQLDDLRYGIDLDARQRQDDYDFLLWVQREYGLNLNYPYPLIGTPRRRR